MSDYFALKIFGALWHASTLFFLYLIHYKGYADVLCLL